jgi:hypothetical protein
VFGYDGRRSGHDRGHKLYRGSWRLR